MIREASRIMSNSFEVPVGRRRVEEVIKRSRFITTLARAPDAEAARAFVRRIQEEFPDATHNCWAFVAGPAGSTMSVGMSDDGEPHGTAGRPMLHVLLHSGVGEVVAVVTRYYGGVKLGTGGLARAYSSGVQLALESLPREAKVDRRAVRIRVSYGVGDAVRRLLETRGIPIDDEVFGEEVEFRVAVPVDALDEIRREVAGLSRGGGVVETVSEAGPSDQI
jgi:uncharacterized YigZ family protein